MPSYDFKCPACGHRFSATVKIAEKDRVTCEKCGGKVQQVFSSCAVVGRASSGGSACSPAGSGFS